MIRDRLRRLLARPDLRSRPVGGLVRRLYWHLRWRFTSRPLLLRLPGALRMYVSDTGNGALLFYQGRSEPETAAFLDRVLKPRMVFYDVGAHLGEYTSPAGSPPRTRLSACVDERRPLAEKMGEPLTRGIGHRDIRDGGHHQAA